MTEFVAVAGIVGQMIAWTVVRRERWPFWPATVVTFAALGVASVLVGESSRRSRVTWSGPG